VSTTTEGPGDTEGPYEIRLQGRLGSRWAARFDGMSITNDVDGTTLLRGAVTDQAALHGLLNYVRDLGLVLLSVSQVSTAVPRPSLDPHVTGSPDA
jgi:hypothetical protein